MPTPARARTFPAAARALALREPVIARLLEATGPPTIPPSKRTAFESLARSITFQQLSGKAAGTIYGRFAAAVGGVPTPESVLATPLEDLRAAGLSAAKAASVIDLAEKVIDGTVPLDDVGRLGDDELIDRLVIVRGIGRWTAEMFLIFRLQRPDVLPVGDLGIVNAIHKAYGLRKKPTPDRMRKLGEAWRPYRSIASWYLWRSLEPPPRKLRPASKEKKSR